MAETNKLKQITRIYEAELVVGEGGTDNPDSIQFAKEVIVGADALRFRNGDAAGSCVMGIGTTASKENQVVVGSYNATESLDADSVFIIGGGTPNTGKNLIEVSSQYFHSLIPAKMHKDFQVDGTTYLQKVFAYNGIDCSQAELKAKTINCTTLTASTIKGTMQTTNGVSYVTETDLTSKYSTSATIANTYVTKETYNTLKSTVDSHTTSISNLQTSVTNLQNGKLPMNPNGIEMIGNSSNVGPYIDFHYAAQQPDYSCRLRCTSPDALTFTCAESSTTNKGEMSFIVKGAIDVGNNGKQLTSWIEHLCPQVNNRYELGDSSYRWKKIFTKALSNSSDKRLKTDIVEIDISKYKDFYLNLKPCSYTFIDDKKAGQEETHFGFIAQDVEQSLKLIPEKENQNYALCEIGDEEKYYGLNYLEMIAMNTAMIQTLITENKELKKEIQTLKGNS